MKTKTHVKIGVHVMVAVALLTAGVALAAAGTVAVGKSIQKKKAGTITQMPVTCGFQAYVADYIVTPTPSAPNHYTLPSLALTAAQTQGDLNGNGTIEICLRSGTSSAPNVYREVTGTDVDFASWSVTNGSGLEPVRIFSDGTPENTRWQRMGSGTTIFIARNSDVTSGRSLTISHIGFYGPRRAIDLASWNASKAPVFLRSDVFSGFQSHAVIAGGNVHLTIDRTRFLGNSGALLAHSDANIQLFFAEFQGNTALATSNWVSGGAIWALDSVKITDQGSLYSENVSLMGGAIFIDGGVGYEGGVTYDGMNVRFMNNQATSNTGSGGGALLVIGGRASVNCGSCVWQENDGGPKGGAISVQGSHEFNDNIFRNNHALTGGAINNFGNVVVTNGLFQGNQSTQGHGGAIWSRGFMDISGTQFIRNRSQNAGGAVYASDNAGLFMDHVDASYNLAYGPGGFLRMENGSLSGAYLDVRANTSTASAIAGMSFVNSGVDLRNSIIAGNTSVIPKHAAGIDVDTTFGGNNFLLLHYVTISGNANTSSGMRLIGNGWMDHIVSAYNEGLQLEGTIPAELDHSNLYSVPPASGEDGILGPYTDGIGNINTDPQFVGDGVTTDPSLSSNILNFDFHLQPTSPAKDIDAGETDVDGSPADAGAYGGPGGGW